MENYSLKDVVDAIYANREELDGTLMVLSSHLERIANALEERNKIEIKKIEAAKVLESAEFNLIEKGKFPERKKRNPPLRPGKINRDYI